VKTSGREDDALPIEALFITPQMVGSVQRIEEADGLEVLVEREEGTP